MRQVQAHLFDTKTGERKVYETEYPDTHEDHMIRFHWAEGGNYNCDCNRSLFLYDYDESKELPCNTGENQIVLEKLVVDGEVIEL